ncbi:nose resistant to fluoxetine protein 6 [Amyelois transitella]|uniref:nose resistant to fluoxetine protein 6 n=1 Tax=Amyelois transitella TaxID=680683 RepID=UPI00299063E0|nr:nose resistant to fluoxetine protein 6 [Amyelois transitella]
MSPDRTLLAVALLALARGAACAELSEEQYYAMPRLFHLDEYEGCLGSRQVYCLGSFELAPLDGSSELFHNMKSFSSNWVDNFNHTRLHRGLCLSRRCPQLGQLQPMDAWFTSCVNASTVSSHQLSARLYKLDYCRRGAPPSPPLSASERALACTLAALLALAALSTALDLSLPAHTKKGLNWALSWSLPGCWRALRAPPPASADTDLAGFDGLRVLGMMCIIIEHVCWLNTLAYQVETRRVEKLRRASDVMMMTNSTLVVQLFFIMSSFLLAHKLLQQRRRGEPVKFFSTVFETMFNRFIRMSPSYFMVLWFAASWWERLGDGPMWTALVGSESAICRHKWWTHLLYLNNVVYADDKCLIQTWYLAADMQLYLFSLLLTLALLRWRRGALVALAALLALAVGVLFALAYWFGLVPNIVLHRPELIRETYRGDLSFNILYQSPLGNLPGALAGLLLAHAHHYLLDSHRSLNEYKVFRWASVAATPLAVWWVAASPQLAGAGEPRRLAAAALAAFERPVFVVLVFLALLGAMQGVESAMRRILSWRGWVVIARLTFGALMLHMIINKSLVAGRLAPTQLDRQTAILEWFGVAFVSYLAAMPLALLVEIPIQRLHKALTALCRGPRRSTPVPSGAKSDGR